MTKGEQISVANGVLNVPNNPIIPFIEPPEGLFFAPTKSSRVKDSVLVPLFLT